MPTPDPAIRDHKAWLGYVQQEGLVVSPAALVDAQVVLDRNTLSMQGRFLSFVKEVAPDGEDPVAAILDRAELPNWFDTFVPSSLPIRGRRSE